MWRTCVRLALCAVAMTAVAFAQYDPPTFTTFQKYPGNDTIHAVQADLNSDGALDFILDGGKTWLSNGDGTYRLGTAPNLGGMMFPVVSGDFDGDGKADIVFSSGGSTEFKIAYGNGDGTWRTVKTYSGIQGTYGNSIVKAVAADFNKDGRQDLAVFVYDEYGPGQKKVAVLTNTGTDFTFSSFSAIEYAYRNPADNEDYPWDIGDFVLGDFDADGKADVAYSVAYHAANQGPQPDHVKVVALFGDGAGHLGNPVVVKDTSGRYSLAGGDMNQDGRSDLAGYFLADPCSADCAGYTVFYGSSGRTFTERKSPNNASNYGFPVIADFDGDRRMDIAMISTTGEVTDGTFGIRVGTQNEDGSFTPQAFYPLNSYTAQSDTVPARFLLASDYNRDMKPDLMTVGDQDDTLYVVTNTTNMEGWAYNTGVGFPNCRQPGGRGLNICAPQQNSVNGDFYNRVPFSAAASDFKPLRKMELWLDGKKVREQFYTFGHHAYFDSLEWDVSVGNHTATFYAVGYDNSLIKKSVSFSVINGYDCGRSSTPATGVTICQPIQGSTVNSPVKVAAVGGTSITWMEVWLGGVKRKSNSGSYIEVDIPLAPGTYTATVYGKVGGTVTDKKQVTFTVAGSGGGTCSPSSATTAVICSPAANATVSSPVSVTAKGGSSVNYMEAWIDGVKKGYVNGNNLSLSVALGSGQHKLTVYAKVNGTITDTKIVYFKVQ